VDRISELALDAGRGDGQALEGFIRCTQADVWRLASLLVDPASAEDVAQEVYLRAIPALARYRAEAPARAWLLSITRRTCADVLRRRGRERRLRRRLEARPTAENVLVQDAETGEVELNTLVAALDPDRREAFVLTQVLGLRYAEAAQVCGVPVGTIRSRVARARGDLLAATIGDDAAEA